MFVDVVVPTQGVVNDLKTHAVAAVGTAAAVGLVIWFIVKVWRAIPKWLLAVVGAAVAVVLLGVVKR